MSCGIGEGLGVRQQAVQQSLGMQLPRGLFDKSRQAVPEPKNIKPELVPLSDQRQEFNGIEIGGRSELQAGSSEVTDRVTVHLNRTRKKYQNSSK